MSVYKRILVATDFSDINRVAVERAAKLAKQDNCELLLLHVIEHFPMGGGPLSSEFSHNIELNEALAQDARTKLGELENSIDHEHVRVDVLVSPNSARREILRAAEANKVDLIVVAPHGGGIIGSLGSTATGVLNNAKCDVLAVREPS